MISYVIYFILLQNEDICKDMIIMKIKILGCKYLVYLQSVNFFPQKAKDVSVWTACPMFFMLNGISELQFLENAIFCAFL